MTRPSREFVLVLGRALLMAFVALVFWRLLLHERIELKRYIFLLGPYFLGWLLMQGIAIRIHKMRFLMFIKGNPFSEVFAYPNVIYASAFFVFCVITMWLQHKMGI